MKNLTILQINDTHSYLELHQEHMYTPDGIEVVKAGGYARLKSLVNDIRKERQNVLLLDNGDTFHGTYDAVASKGMHMVPVIRHMGFDAMTFHWDAAYTPAHLKTIEEKLEHPILAINCYDKQTDELYFKPYLLKEYGDFKVGIIGIASSIIDKTMPPAFSEGVYFTFGNEELPGYIDEVRQQGADLVILLSHNGFPQDIKMLHEVAGVDVCISGHTHNRIEVPVKVNDTYVIQSGSHGSFLGRLDVTFDDKIREVAHELIFAAEDIPEDADMKKLVEDALSANRAMLAETVGETKDLLHRATSLNAPMDNLILKSLLSVTGADVAFSNGWRYGVPIQPGQLTLEDLHRIIPVNPPVSTAVLSGQEIWDMLEENLHHTFSGDPYEQMGGYVKRAMGLKAYIKVENPNTLRLQQVFIGNEPLEKAAAYRVAYVTKQGVPKEKYGREHKDLEIHAVDAIRQLLQKGPYADDSPAAFEVV